MLERSFSAGVCVRVAGITREIMTDTATDLNLTIIRDHDTIEHKPVNVIIKELIQYGLNEHTITIMRLEYVELQNYHFIHA